MIGQRCWTEFVVTSEAERAKAMKETGQTEDAEREQQGPGEGSEPTESECSIGTGQQNEQMNSP